MPEYASQRVVPPAEALGNFVVFRQPQAGFRFVLHGGDSTRLSASPNRTGWTPVTNNSLSWRYPPGLPRISDSAAGRAPMAASNTGALPLGAPGKWHL